MAIELLVELIKNLANSLTILSSVMHHNNKPLVKFSLKGSFLGFPSSRYFLYVQGFLHPVTLDIARESLAIRG